MDKSQTHVKVIKNGIEDTLPKNVWVAIGAEYNKDGWILIPNTPPEAIEIKMKSKAVEEAPVAPQPAQAVVGAEEIVKKAKKVKA